MGSKYFTIGSNSYVWGTGTPFWASVNCGGSNDPKRHKIPRPYSADIQRLIRTPSYAYRDGKLEQGPIWVAWGLGTMAPAADANMINQVLSKLAEAIRGGHSWNAAIMAAESRESVTQLRNMASAVLGVAHGLATRNADEVLRCLGRTAGQVDRKSLRKKLRVNDVSGAWLAIQFGIKPLLNDLQEAAKAYESISKLRSLRYTASQTHSISFDDRASTAYNVLPGKSFRTVKYIVTLQENISIARAIGLIDLASVAWEKIPWSFLIDYVIPIGTYLSNVGTLGGLKGSWVVSNFCKTRTKGPKAQKDYPSINYKTLGGSWDFERVVFQRTVGSGSLPVPMPTFKHLDKVFSLGHVQNTAALLQQQIGPLIRLRNKGYTS